jgi:hypothetical protein
LKEWGGLASLIIAVGYSFPLGVWDRFIASEQERTARAISSLRAAVAESADIVADAGRTLSGIIDPVYRDQVARAFNTKMLILMATNERAIELYMHKLTPHELGLVAYNYQLIDRLDRTVALYDVALAMPEASGTLRVELQRLKGQALFYPSQFQDLPLARKSYADAREAATTIRGLPGVRIQISVLGDWARAELTAGDWQCGRILFAAAEELVQRHSAALGERGQYMAVLQPLDTITQQSGQPALGCDL